MRRLSSISTSIAFLVTTLALVAPAAAQQSPAIVPPPVAGPLPADQGQQPPPPPAAPPASTPRPGQTPSQAPQPPQGQQGQQGQRPSEPPPMVNIRVELAITEMHGSTVAVKKTVFLITRSDSRASVRSTLSQPGGTMAVNVDARPHLEKDGRVTLNLTFQYAPEPVAAPADGGRPADLNETMEIILTDAKPLLISQSADPKGDRKVTVEVTATIIK